MSIKPIETIYKGYRFRSRLEARWAVFFETLGIPWEYEKEGFDINGTYYLPDFYLPDIDTWIEIKPGDPEKWPEHFILNFLCEFLDGGDVDCRLTDIPFNNFVLIVGQPWMDIDGTGWGERDWEYCGYIPGDCYYRFCECPVCGKIGIQFEGRAARICRSCCPNSDREQNTHTPRLIAAYKAARQARFEHGEQG